VAAARDFPNHWMNACKLGLEGIVSKKLDASYKSGPSKAWLKIKNPEAPAATRALDGTF
jgi:ATP-dependent DNA ligase